MKIAKPYKSWDRYELYRRLVAVNPSLKERALDINPQEKLLREEFLKLEGNYKGKDVYSFDDDKARAFTSERLDELIAKSKLRQAQPKQQGRYIVRYLHKTEPYILESDVTVTNQKFMGEDGYEHHLKERHCEIVEIILNPNG